MSTHTITNNCQFQPKVTLTNISDAILKDLNAGGAYLHIYLENKPCDRWRTLVSEAAVKLIIYVTSYIVIYLFILLLLFFFFFFRRGGEGYS